jgi:hypothetical protein
VKGSLNDYVTETGPLRSTCFRQQNGLGFDVDWLYQQGNSRGNCNSLMLIKQFKDVCITSCCTVLYLLYSLRHVSALNLDHPQGATSLFDLYSVCGNVCVCNGRLYTSDSVLR